MKCGVFAARPLRVITTPGSKPHKRRRQHLPQRTQRRRIKEGLEAGYCPPVRVRGFTQRRDGEETRKADSQTMGFRFPLSSLCPLWLFRSMTARLNVNIDHVATVRQARRTIEPSVVAA